ncbi:MAG: hypothetical protein ACI9R3_005412 [Verrucomicrobiales bacterium]
MVPNHDYQIVEILGNLSYKYCDSSESPECLGVLDDPGRDFFCLWFGDKVADFRVDAKKHLGPGFGGSSQPAQPRFRRQAIFRSSDDGYRSRVDEREYPSTEGWIHDYAKMQAVKQVCSQIGRFS